MTNLPAAPTAPDARAWRSWVSEALRTIGVDDPLSEKKLILSHAGVAPFDRVLTQHQMLEVRRLVSGRAERLPMQHLTGKMYFRYLELEALPGVFIVRPETEVLVEFALHKIREALPRKERLVIADFCTGSGAIALSLATELAGEAPGRIRVYAVENSRTALASARRNIATYADRINPPIMLMEADATSVTLPARPDFIVTNPPYVPAGGVTQPEALQDPPEALYGGGEQGLEIPMQILEHAYGLLAPGGWILMEHDVSQGHALCWGAAQIGYGPVQTAADLAGRPRFIAAQKPEKS